MKEFTIDMRKGMCKGNNHLAHACIMKNNKRIFISSLVTVVAAGSIGVGVAQASFHNNKNLRRDAVHRVVEKEKLHENQHRLIDFSTSKTFDAIHVAHNFRKMGDFEKAREVLENAGIERSENMPHKIRNQSEIKDIVAAGDWDAYQTAIVGTRMADVINTREKFDLMREMQDLRKDGRWEEAQEIARQLHII